MKCQHLPVPDLQLRHGLGVIGQKLAIVIEVLGGLGDLGLRLDRLFQGAHGGVGGDLEGEEVGILMRGSGDGQRDAPGEEGRS